MDSASDERPLLEYIAVSPAELKQAQQEVAEFAQHFLERQRQNMNGAAISPLWPVFIRSLFGSLLHRDREYGAMNRISGIASDVIAASLNEFRRILESSGHDMHLKWEDDVHRFFKTLHNDGTSLFRTYVMGLLSDRFHVDEDDADRIINEFEKRGTLRRAGSQYRFPLIKISDTRQT